MSVIFSESAELTSPALIEVLRRLSSLSLPIGNHLVLRGSLLVNSYSGEYKNNYYRIPQDIDFVFVTDSLIVDDKSARNFPVQPLRLPLTEQMTFNDSFDDALKEIVYRVANHEKLQVYHDLQHKNFFVNQLIDDDLKTDNKVIDDLYIPLHLVGFNSTFIDCYFPSRKLFFPVFQLKNNQWQHLQTVSVDIASGDPIIGPVYEMKLEFSQTIDSNGSSCQLKIEGESPGSVVAASLPMLIAWKVNSCIQEKYNPGDNIIRFEDWRAKDIFDLQLLLNAFHKIMRKKYGGLVDTEVEKCLRDHLHLAFASRNEDLVNLLRRKLFHKQFVDAHSEEWNKVYLEFSDHLHESIQNIKRYISFIDPLPRPPSARPRRIPVGNQAECCSIQ